MVVKVGLLGCGTVGSGTAKILLEDQDLLKQKLGLELKLAKVVAKDPPLSVNLPKGMYSNNFADVVGNPEIDIVAELMGGIEPAKSLILKAISCGQHVVTANKALLATCGQEIFAAAKKAEVEVMFEAAVAGGIPIIRTLKEGLSANYINYLWGILNGTTNYILSKMTHEGVSFNDALKEAQKEGFAEADPTFDVEGIDAAHKLVILTAMSYGVWPSMDDLFIEGISSLTVDDINFAKDFGYVIKLLAISNCDGQKVEARLHPTMIPSNHLLASVDGAMNAVYINGHAVGDILLYGAGAGMMPTASAVVSDLMELARIKKNNQASGVPHLGWDNHFGRKVSLKEISEIETSYYFRFTVADQAGVLSKLSGILGDYNISIAKVLQKGHYKDSSVPVVMLTHKANEEKVSKALKDIAKADLLMASTMVIRVEDQL